MRALPGSLALAGLILASGCVSDATPVGALAGVDDSYTVLSDRSEYQRLDQAAVEDLARAAEVRWKTRFEAFGGRRVERFAAGGESHWMAIWTHRRTGLEFVLVPGGRFLMGSSPSEEDRDPDETQSEVTLDPFLIARTECTQAVWARVATGTALETEPSYFGGRADHPVEQVSAVDAEAWCEVAGLELPTEVQREFACRAGTTTAFAFGRSLDPTQGRTGNGFEDGPVAVGSLSPNAFGLFDVHGNIWEWCREHPPGTSASWVLRGGSYFNASGWARSADRSEYAPNESSRLTGFRPSLDLPPEALSDPVVGSIRPGGT